MVHQNRPLSTLLLYALPAIGLAALTLPLYVVVPTFYAESLGLSVQSIGLALLAVRLFDAVNDPVFGWLSDRWQPTFGRRRLWFIVFVPVAIWGAFKLFWPPSGVDVSYLFLWSLVLSIGYTGAILPYTAWGAELETTYSGRSRISSIREGFVLVGTLLAISVPFTVGWTDPNSVHGLAYLAIGIVAFLSISAAIAVWCVPEPQDFSNERLSLIDGLKPILRNLPFKRLVLAFFLNGMGNAIAATLFLLYCSERLALEEWRGPFLFLYFFAGIAGIPIWLSLANKTSKHQAWCIAMVCAVLVFSPAPFLPAGLVWPFLIVCLLSGLTLGADLALPAAMQADVIDIDTADTKEQRSGFYFALWSFTTKLSLALAVGTVFPLLGWFGFDPTPNASSTAIGITLLGFLYGWGPIAFKIPAIILMWNFSLNRHKVNALRQQIEATHSTA